MAQKRKIDSGHHCYWVETWEFQLMNEMNRYLESKACIELRS